jgi:hypothetical protein
MVGQLQMQAPRAEPVSPYFPRRKPSTASV